ncbi:MAG: 4Fe-4S binding protein, partial [Gammaproteobacteria bacterium]|nr:4Fe-4S binding protein [Gammaproteobacteria bacterium]
LRAYRDADGTGACVLFYDRERGHDIAMQHAARMGGNVLPFVVEEIGSVGLDVWLAVLAYGAERVMLLANDSIPAAIRREVDHQLSIGHRLLAGMGYAPQRISWLDAADYPDTVGVPTDAAFGNAAAGFAAVGGKRAVLRMALDHLHDCAPARADCIELPDGAPFGAIQLDADACTLCMACVSVCPAGALEDGGDSPALRFIEWNCVQCGICESACPEHAIRREPRYLLDAERRLSTCELKSEEPFRCVQCGKAFATQSVIRRMHEKLAGHRMFKDASALRRLEMCEDCRVKDMFTESGNYLS